MENSQSYIPIISIIISFLAAAFSIFTFTESRRRSVVERTFAFLDEWRENSFFETAQLLQDEKFYDGITAFDIEKGTACLGPEKERQFKRVSHFMDYLGAAAQSNILDEKLLFTAISGSIENLWKVMGTIIKAERAKRACDENNKDRAWRYQSGFEHLAEKSRIFRQHGLHLEMWTYRGKLKDLWRLDDSANRQVHE